MPSSAPVCLLLLALPLACATPAARPGAADAKGAPADAALSLPSALPLLVDGPAAKRLVAGGARLVDVRDAQSYAAGHIPGAIHLEVVDVAARAAREIGPVDTPVVLYCRTGVRSAKAAGILVGMGYTRVYDLGSYRNWEEGALPAAPPPGTAPKS